MRSREHEAGVLSEAKLVRFQELHDALLFGGDCWLPIGVQLAFEVYRWMLSSADERGDRWNASDDYASRRYPDILAAIGGEGVGGVNVTTTALFGKGWREDLPKRLLNALRSGSTVVARWRDEQRIDLARARRVQTLIYDSPIGAAGRAVGEAGVARRLDALFALCSPERRLNAQLNPSHPDARRVTRVGLWVVDGRWMVSMEYGYDGSSWDGGWAHSSAARERGEDPLRAVQHKDEPFYDFLSRARRHLERVLTPACNHRRPPAYRSPGCNGNWTGITADGVEYIGGCVLSEHVAVWKASGIHPGPVLLRGEQTPRTVEERDGKKLVLSDGGWPMLRELSADEYVEGRVRFDLRLGAYRRAYLDLSREERSLADRFLAPGQNGLGSAPREFAEAMRYIDEVRPVPFEEWCPADAQTPCEP